MDFKVFTCLRNVAKILKQKISITSTNHVINVDEGIVDSHYLNGILFDRRSQDKPTNATKSEFNKNLKSKYYFDVRRFHNYPTKEDYLISNIFKRIYKQIEVQKKISLPINSNLRFAHDESMKMSR